MDPMLEAFLVSTGVVALAEMGDKTQLLALLLAARFRSAPPVVAGIFVATLANHAIAALLGAGIAEAIGRDALRWILGVSFLAMAGWTLIPDRIDNEQQAPGRFGAFGTTLIAFFLVEIGDKTQIATVALAANYASVAAVVAGTTLGMMIADVPAVYLGERILRRIPMRLLQRIAALAFAILGALVLLA
jgi:putative Ca2+/H+ antiporter (TMEM165/GDT1 family)